MRQISPQKFDAKYAILSELQLKKKYFFDGKMFCELIRKKNISVKKSSFFPCKVLELYTVKKPLKWSLQW
jgi:hypothetical protein